MKMTEFFRDQLDREVPICRRMLERAPEGRPDWKPHEKSMPLGYLSMLVATMPGWVAMAIRMDELDLNPGGGPPPQMQTWTKASDLVRALEDSASKSREALAGTNDAHLLTPWRLLVSGRVVSEALRHVVIADAFTHLAHHRGQLSVYLRLSGSLVPSVYGPSADDRTF
jgi:hypothetical protein